MHFASSHTSFRNCHPQSFVSILAPEVTYWNQVMYVHPNPRQTEVILVSASCDLSWLHSLCLKQGRNIHWALLLSCISAGRHAVENAVINHFSWLQKSIPPCSPSILWLCGLSLLSLPPDHNAIGLRGKWVEKALLGTGTEDKGNGEQIETKAVHEEGVSYEIDVWGNYSLDSKELRGEAPWKVLSFYILADGLETFRKAIALIDRESLKRMSTHHRSHKLLANPSLKILNIQSNAFLICFTVSAGSFSKFKTVHQTWVTLFEVFQTAGFFYTIVWTGQFMAA